MPKLRALDESFGGPERVGNKDHNVSDTEIEPESVASLQEIRALFAELPAADEEAAAAAEARQAVLTKPPGSLGRLEELAVWLAAWQGRHPPGMDRPHVAVFAGNHGVAARGVLAFPAEVTRQMVANFIDGGAAINQLAALAEAELRVHEMSLETPTEDFTQAPAMTEEACAKAMAYGMMAVEPGFDAYALGEMGIANTTSAAALCHGLFGGAPEDWTGRGTGVDDETLARKTAVVGEGVALHKAALDDPLEVMRRLGGLELAAIAGSILAARLARTPVILDGYTCTAAAAVLHAVDPGAIDHCLVSQSLGGTGSPQAGRAHRQETLARPRHAPGRRLRRCLGGPHAPGRLRLS